MLTKLEITRLAKERGISAEALAKDYVLEWLLKGFYSQKYPMHKHLVFKGGTSIRKVHFPQVWRLSEDLDFSFIGIENPQLEQVGEMLSGRKNWGLKQFLEDIVLKDLNEESGIYLKLDDYHANPGMISSDIQYKVDVFIGRVKFDLKFSEKLLFEPETRELQGDYPDIPPIKVLSYPLKEIMVEKVCAMMDRGKARDFYDVWRLLREGNFDLLELRPFIIKKCSSNNFTYNPNFMTSSKLREAQKYWKSSLEHLVKDNELPDFDEVTDEIQQYIEGMELAYKIEVGDETHTHILTLARIAAKNERAIAPVIDVAIALTKQSNPTKVVFGLNLLQSLVSASSLANGKVQNIEKRLEKLKNDPNEQIAYAAQNLLNSIWYKEVK
ncbi:MAG: nucleotidyl transferase AbiEii/AbiGii toxin family protein [Candidatus Micrarchaeota archaeon]